MTGIALQYTTEIYGWKESLMNYLFSMSQLEQRLQLVIAHDSITDIGIKTETFLTLIENYVDKGHTLSGEIVHQQAVLNYDGKLLEDQQITERIRNEQSRLRDEMSDLEIEYSSISIETKNYLRSISS